MADEEQVTLLKSGVEAWNKWREENPDAAAKLFEADLAGVELSEANLRRADLQRVQFPDSDLAHVDLRDANLRDANLETVDGLQSCQLGGALTSLAK